MLVRHADMNSSRTTMSLRVRKVVGVSIHKHAVCLSYGPCPHACVLARAVEQRAGSKQRGSREMGDATNPCEIAHASMKTSGATHSMPTGHGGITIWLPKTPASSLSFRVCTSSVYLLGYVDMKIVLPLLAVCMDIHFSFGTGY